MKLRDVRILKHSQTGSKKRLRSTLSEKEIRKSNVKSHLIELALMKFGMTVEHLLGIFIEYIVLLMMHDRLILRDFMILKVETLWMRVSHDKADKWISILPCFFFFSFVFQ
jgi:hypothetical protein